WRKSADERKHHCAWQIGTQHPVGETLMAGWRTSKNGKGLAKKDWAPKSAKKKDGGGKRRGGRRWLELARGRWAAILAGCSLVRERRWYLLGGRCLRTR